jgi:hypothetical protein
MHFGPMPESAGEFTKSSQRGDLACRKCKVVGQVTCQTWESSDGAYEDYKYTCGACGAVWWIDGIDS